MNICLVLSSGSSVRFGGGYPKQYALLNGREVISYSIDSIKISKNADVTVCIASADYVKHVQKQYDVETIIGGSSRNETLRNGLEYIKKKYPLCNKVFINEAARPFLTASIVDEYFNKLDEYDSVITTQCLTDSLGKYRDAITNRADYYLIQAPEAFRFDLLYKHFKADSPLTATVQQLPLGSSVFYNFDFRHNLKITYPEDLIMAQALMRYVYDKTDRA